jgi:hypothetical protein
MRRPVVDTPLAFTGANIFRTAAFRIGPCRRRMLFVVPAAGQSQPQLFMAPIPITLEVIALRSN